MKHNIFFYYCLKRIRGFTLIEMALIIVALGVFVSTAAIVMQSLAHSRKIEENRKLLAKYDRSVRGFLTTTYFRTICPDINGDGKEDFIGCSLGMDACSEYTGYLPYRSLGLPSGKDAWGNLVKFSIYDVGATGVDVISNHIELCDFFLEEFPDDDPNDDGDDGDDGDGDGDLVFSGLKIYIDNATGVSHNQAYIIVSGGPKGLDGNRLFFDGLNGGAPDLKFESPDKVASSTYDDFVIAVSFEELYNEVCTASGEVP